MRCCRSTEEIYKIFCGKFSFLLTATIAHIKVTTQLEHKKSDYSMAVRTCGHPHVYTLIVDIVLSTADLPLSCCGLVVMSCNSHSRGCGF